MLFPPHPDDECVNGGLALRLLREAGMRVITVVVTLGSKLERRPGALAGSGERMPVFGVRPAGAGSRRLGADHSASAPERTTSVGKIRGRDGEDFANEQAACNPFSPRAGLERHAYWDALFADGCAEGAAAGIRVPCGGDRILGGNGHAQLDRGIQCCRCVRFGYGNFVSCRRSAPQPISPAAPGVDAGQCAARGRIGVRTGRGPAGFHFRHEPSPEPLASGKT